MYLIGDSVPQSEEEAVRWYRKAAEQGLPQAQYCLGNMYKTGNGMEEKDESEAVRWFLKAAEQDVAYLRKDTPNCLRMERKEKSLHLVQKSGQREGAQTKRKK